MKRLFILGVAVVSIATLKAQKENKENSEIENALLWEISGNGLTKTSYIYGTMHIGDKKILEYEDTVSAVVHSVDAVYAEIDLTDLAAQMAVMKDMVMLGTSLTELVTEEEHALIKKTLEGTPGALMMDQIKPFFTMGNMATMFLPADDLVMLDMHFLELGKKLGKEVSGIETMQEQVDAVNTLTLKEQAKMLVEMCEEFDKQKELFQRMYKLYLDQDINELTALAASEMEDLESAEFESEILEKRNVKMVNRLDKIMKEKSVFFAVGALHLTGEEGLIKLLEKSGYTVKPLHSAKN